MTYIIINKIEIFKSIFVLENFFFSIKFDLD